MTGPVSKVQERTVRAELVEARNTVAIRLIGFGEAVLFHQLELTRRRINGDEQWTGHAGEGHHRLTRRQSRNQAPLSLVDATD